MPHPTVPAMTAALLRHVLHAAEREEVMADTADELAVRTARDGRLRARLWLWRQVAFSAWGMLARSWLRGSTGFESEANRMRAGGSRLEGWLLDARFAARGLRKRPQYVLLAVLTLALGIGGTSAIFGIARVLLVNPLPYEASDELVMFWNAYDWSEEEVAYLRPEWPGFDGVAAYTPQGVFMKRPGSPAQLVPGLAASVELFDVLGARWQQLAQIIERLAALPGVQRAGAIQLLPLVRRGDNWGISIQSKPELESSTTALRLVTRDYFDVLDIGLLSGRVFDETDRAGTDLVIVIDELLARRYFPGEDPIGQYIGSGIGQGWMRVIGVVGNVTHGGLTAEPVPGRYVLYDQFNHTPEAASLVLRVERGRNAAGVLQQAVRTIEQTGGSVAVQEATTMENVHALAMGPTRRIMQLMTLLGALALTLGAVGVYGVVSHFVNRRRRDWVIRMALGMRPAAALRQVVGRSALLIAAGCVLGIAASLALTRLLSSLLYGVGAADPIALAGAVAALIVTGCIAALVPGVRATRISPAQALRDST